jgi:soluble lytic murein transglycosylase-like protein
VNRSKRIQLALIFILFFRANAFGGIINLSRISEIESNNNPKAFNARENSFGLNQIRSKTLDEYNKYNKTHLRCQDLFNAEINNLVATWYLETRIPSMLRYYHKEVSVRNIIISYNAGISYVVKGKKLPEITRRYLRKYDGR